MIQKTLVLATALAILSGCSAGSLLNNKAGVPQATAIPVGNDLALPPDLSLQAPTQTVEGYQPNGQVAALEEEPVTTARAAPIARRQPAAPVQDSYARYGISKVNPDGTPKDQVALQRELKAAILAEKRKTKPGYGTIWNMGELFGG